MFVSLGMLFPGTEIPPKGINKEGGCTKVQPPSSLLCPWGWERLEFVSACAISCSCREYLHELDLKDKCAERRNLFPSLASAIGKVLWNDNLHLATSLLPS